MPDRPHTVFVSHAHADNELCDRYVAALRNRGLDVWYDRNNLQIGDSLSETIEKQLRQRTELVALYTAASVGSKWVRREVAAFQHLADRDPSRLLIVVKAAECEVPLLMMDALWADSLTLGFDATIDALAKALEAPGVPAMAAPTTQASVDKLAAQGRALMAQKQYAEAILFLERASQRDPRSFDAWANLGLAYNETGRHGDDLTAYDRALSLDDTQAWVWHNKGKALRDLTRPQEALAAYERALALDPKDTLAWNGKGATLNDLKRYEEALVANEQALALDPNYTLVWHNKGNALSDLRRFEEAFAAYDHALALDPQYVVALKNKAITLRRAGRPAEADAADQRARELEKKRG